MAPKTETNPVKIDTELPANRGIPDASHCGFQHDNAEERDAVFHHIKRYSSGSWGRACWELTHSLAFYWMAWQYRDTWWGLLLISLLRVRLFIIFHDCAHDAFFPSSTVNVVVGTLLNAVHHVSFSFWARGHNHHHRHRYELCWVSGEMGSSIAVKLSRKICWFGFASGGTVFPGFSRVSAVVQQQHQV
jgi:hypothetical protein